jgi:hypothetical protein
MYAVIFKAKFLAIVLPYRDKLFNRKEVSVLIAKMFNKVAVLHLICKIGQAKL